jgi:hypothetical protein
MSEIPRDAVDELVAGVRLTVIRKLDEATDWSAVLADIYQRGQPASDDVEPSTPAD